jgi:toxin ParE1/3/4
MRLRWLTAALASLRTAHAYIALDNPTAARKATARVEAAVERLRKFPLSGRIGTVSDTRELVVPGAPYIVVYHVADDEVVIIRVFHEKQNRQGISDWEGEQ